MYKKDVLKQYEEHAKTYKSHAEEYSKHYNKPYQEPHHHESIHLNKSQWKIAQEQIKPNPNPLSKSELEYLFWNRLVQLGWKKGDGNLESHQLMLVCDECDRAIISQQSHTVTFDKARQMSDKVSVKNEIKKHRDKCKPLEYDENGDVVEAISGVTIAAPLMNTGIDISAEAEAMLAKNMVNWLDEHLETDYK